MIDNDILERIWYLRTWCFNFELFKEIYKRPGENPDDQFSLANHMWRKFNKESKGDFLVFYRMNDDINKIIILDYLNSKQFDKKFTENMMIEK